MKDGEGMGNCAWYVRARGVVGVKLWCVLVVFGQILFLLVIYGLVLVWNWSGNFD